MIALFYSNITFSCIYINNCNTWNHLPSTSGHLVFSRQHKCVSLQQLTLIAVRACNFVFSSNATSAQQLRMPGVLFNGTGTENLILPWHSNETNMAQNAGYLLKAFWIKAVVRVLHWKHIIFRYYYPCTGAFCGRWLGFCSNPLFSFAWLRCSACGLMGFIPAVAATFLWGLSARTPAHSNEALFKEQQLIEINPLLWRAS